MGEISVCPFCGGDAQLGIIRDGRQVHCQSCRATGPAIFFGPEGPAVCKQAAADAWNKANARQSLRENGAWYPSRVDVFRVVNANEYSSPAARADAIIRRTIDLYRERQWCLTMARAELESGSDVEAGIGELIARQPIQPAPEVPVVPDEIMEAAADVSFYCRAVEKDDAKLNVQLRKVLAFLQSFQGAGHGQG